MLNFVNVNIFNNKKRTTGNIVPSWPQKWSIVMHIFAPRGVQKLSVNSFQLGELGFSPS